MKTPSEVIGELMEPQEGRIKLCAGIHARMREYRLKMQKRPILSPMTKGIYKESYRRAQFRARAAAWFRR